MVFWLEEKMYVSVLDVKIILQEMLFFIINMAFGYTVIIYNYEKESMFCIKGNYAS